MAPATRSDVTALEQITSRRIASVLNDTSTHIAEGNKQPIVQALERYRDELRTFSELPDDLIGQLDLAALAAHVPVFDGRTLQEWRESDNYVKYLIPPAGFIHNILALGARRTGAELLFENVWRFLEKTLHLAAQLCSLPWLGVLVESIAAELPKAALYSWIVRNRVVNGRIVLSLPRTVYSEMPTLRYVSAWALEVRRDFLSEPSDDLVEKVVAQKRRGGTGSNEYGVEWLDKLSDKREAHKIFADSIHHIEAAARYLVALDYDGLDTGVLVSSVLMFRDVYPPMTAPYLNNKADVDRWAQGLVELLAWQTLMTGRYDIGRAESAAHEYRVDIASASTWRRYTLSVTDERGTPRDLGEFQLQ